MSVRQALLEGGVPELVDRACLTEDLPGRGVLEQAGEYRHGVATHATWTQTGQEGLHRPKRSLT